MTHAFLIEATFSDRGKTDSSKLRSFEALSSCNLKPGINITPLQYLWRHSDSWTLIYMLLFTIRKKDALQLSI